MKEMEEEERLKKERGSELKREEMIKKMEERFRKNKRKKWM